MNIKIKSISIKTKESQVDIDDIEIDLDPSALLKSSSPLDFSKPKFGPSLFKEIQYDPFKHMNFESSEKQDQQKPFFSFDPSLELTPENVIKWIDNIFSNNESPKKNDLND